MLKAQIEKSLQILQAGGLILYPTDTVWGIGCDATNTEAVEKVFKLKGRESSKSLIILLDTENKLDAYVQDVPVIAYDLVEYAEAPLTIIYSGAKNLAPNVIANDGSIGIRIVKHDFCKQLLQRFKKPIVSTSANLSGSPTPTNFQEIEDEIRTGVNYIVALEQDDFTPKKSSTIMKLEADGRFAFIRR